MDGIIAYILSRNFTKNTVIGMGAIKGAPCQVQSIVKVDKTTTITLKWEDNEGGVHTQDFDVEDGIDVSDATIAPNGHLMLTLSDGTVKDCGKVLPQYDTMPAASASNEGQILQYIGGTTSNYTNGYFYKCENDGSGNYRWVAINTQDSYTKSEIGNLTNLPDNTKDIVQNITDLYNNKENKFRVNLLPTPSTDYIGKILQYIGDNTPTATNGYYYQCKEVSPNVYQWVQKDVQPANGGGGDSVVEGYFNSTDNLFYEESTYVHPIIGASNTIYISLDTNQLYRYNGTIFIRVDESDGEIDYGIVDLKTNLPNTFGVNDRKIYFVIEESSFYLWQGTAWEIILPQTITNADIDALFD